MHQTLP